MNERKKKYPQAPASSMSVMLAHSEASVTEFCECDANWHARAAAHWPRTIYDLRSIEQRGLRRIARDGGWVGGGSAREGGLVAGCQGMGKGGGAREQGGVMAMVMVMPTTAQSPSWFALICFFFFFLSSSYYPSMTTFPCAFSLPHLLLLLLLLARGGPQLGGKRASHPGGDDDALDALKPAAAMGETKGEGRESGVGE